MGLRHRRGDRDSAHRCGGFTLLLLIATVLPWVAPSDARGQSAGDLVVAPTRIVFEGRTRTAQISLLNRGSAVATYRISLVNMRMTEDGGFKKIDEPAPGEQFADRLIRYAPRQVVLAPGDSQAVRLLLRKPRGLEPGEYRSHLLFRAIPSQNIGTSVEEPPSNDTGIRIRLIPIYGVTIPVIVRHGDLTAKVSLTDLALVPAGGQGEGDRLSFRINRDGDRSVFGDLTVTYFPNGGKADEVVVAQITRLAVYTPNAGRTVMMPLRFPDGVTLGHGRLHVAFREIPKNGGALLTEAEIGVP
jgi:P pilus assembly chaperone PapD